MRTFNDINEAYPDPDESARGIAESFLRDFEAGNIAKLAHWSKEERECELHKLRTDPEYVNVFQYLNYQEIWDGMQSAFPEIGILCMTREWNNLLMWAHYAKCDSVPAGGLCLGFDETSATFSNLGIPEFKLKGEYKVVYSNMRASLGSDFCENLTRSLVTKSQDWSYEKEVRFFTRLGENESSELVTFTPQDVCEIHLGPKLCMDCGGEFVNYCRLKFPRANLYLTVPDLDSFQLIRIPAPCADKFQYIVTQASRLP